jgi:hypothetical protein
MLPSGLPEEVGNEEHLARFLTQSNQYSRSGVKLAAFLPSPKTQDVSVSRHGAEPLHGLKELGLAATHGRSLHGAAIIQTVAVRRIGLTVVADEPPACHALLHRWPQFGDDPEARKARHKQLALDLASEALLIAPL